MENLNPILKFPFMHYTGEPRDPAYSLAHTQKSVLEVQLGGKGRDLKILPPLDKAQPGSTVNPACKTENRENA